MTVRDIAVVKYGSSSVANGQGMDQSRVDRYAENVADLRQRYDVIVVTSGAIAAGACLWREQHGPKPLPSQQTCATLGSDASFGVWRRAFHKQGILIGSVLATHHDIDDHEEGGMLKSVLERNIEAGLVSVVNENDALSNEEIKAFTDYGGDNDGLATTLAVRMMASHLCLMTQIEGEAVLDAEGQPIHEITASNFDSALSAARRPGPMGRGGMRSKITAAHDAALQGVTAHIAHATSPLQTVIDGDCGTHFPSEQW